MRVCKHMIRVGQRNRHYVVRLYQLAQHHVVRLYQLNQHHVVRLTVRCDSDMLHFEVLHEFERSRK